MKNRTSFNRSHAHGNSYRFFFLKEKNDKFELYSNLVAHRSIDAQSIIQVAHHANLVYLLNTHSSRNIGRESRKGRKI